MSVLEFGVVASSNSIINPRGISIRIVQHAFFSPCSLGSIQSGVICFPNLVPICCGPAFRRLPTTTIQEKQSSILSLAAHLFFFSRVYPSNSFTISLPLSIHSKVSFINFQCKTSDHGKVVRIKSQL